MAQVDPRQLIAMIKNGVFDQNLKEIILANTNVE